MLGCQNKLKKQPQNHTQLGSFISVAYITTLTVRNLVDGICLTHNQEGTMVKHDPLIWYRK